jgi:CRP/FNR family transcriptional regulator
MTCGNSSCPFHELKSGSESSPDGRFSCLVADAVKQVRFEAGETLFAQGDPSTSLYSLSSGLVKITNLTRDGREQIVGLSTPSRLLAGLQSLSDECYEYSAVAETPVEACMIRHRALLQAVNNRGDIALRLIGAMNAQLAHSRDLMRAMGQKGAAAKIASLIGLIIPHCEHRKSRYTLPFSRNDIANVLGLTEETVCRQMAKMKRLGILYAPRGKIEILDWDRLEALAREESPEFA